MKYRYILGSTKWIDFGSGLRTEEKGKGVDESTDDQRSLVSIYRTNVALPALGYITIIWTPQEQ